MRPQIVYINESIVGAQVCTCCMKCTKHKIWIKFVRSLCYMLAAIYWIMTTDSKIIATFEKSKKIIKHFIKPLNKFMPNSILIIIWLTFAFWLYHREAGNILIAPDTNQQSQAKQQHRNCTERKDNLVSASKQIERTDKQTNESDKECWPYTPKLAKINCGVRCAADGKLNSRCWSGAERPAWTCPFLLLAAWQSRQKK